jgi:hypothetical protein
LEDPEDEGTYQSSSSIHGYLGWIQIPVCVFPSQYTTLLDINDSLGAVLVSQGARQFINTKYMNNVARNHDMHPAGHDQPPNLHAIMDAISSAQLSPAERRALALSLAGARPLDRSASIGTAFGDKSRPPPPYQV